MQRIKRDIHGRFHDEKGRFVKIELNEEELESMLDKVRLNQVDENTYERINEEFVFKESRNSDEVFFNITGGSLCLVVILMWIEAFV